MSPARVIEPTEQERQLQALAKGFDALLLTVQHLNCKEQELQRRLKYAHDEYMKLADRLPGGSDTGVSSVADKIINGDSSSPLERSLEIQDIIGTLRQSGHVDGPSLEAINEGLESYKWIEDRGDANGLHVRSNPCLVAAARRSSNLERDFTTNGVQGTLRCPFAKSKDTLNSNNGMPNGTHDLLRGQNGDTCGNADPIKAESHRDKLSSPTMSARSSAARCPIRYLDQHSPEEVAQYFENHKHEIPRSHAICVKRYQSDSQSIRHLDAKYGSIVNMIQGLGVKHQAFLPNQNRSGGPGSSSASAERVERWAEDVSSKSARPPTLTTVEEDRAEGHEDRKSHFERPLREVRVGESPSRPWGITVPPSHQPTPSALQSPPATVPVPTDKGSPESKKPVESAIVDPSPATPLHDSPASARPAGRCPFHLGASRPKDVALETELPPQERKRNDTSTASDGNTPGAHAISPDMTRSTSPSPTKMVFNGPVFFGYSAEQAVALMQQLGTSGVAK